MTRQRKLCTPFVAPAVAIILLSGAALCRAADTRPADTRNSGRDWVDNNELRPEDRDPDRDARDARREDDRGPRPRDRDDRRPPRDETPLYGERSEDYRSDYPAGDVRYFVMANRRAARARAEFRLAENHLNQAVRDEQAAFDNSRDMRDAVAQEKKAYDEYTAARANALKGVVADPKYQAAVQLRDDLTEQIRQRRSNRTLTHEAMLALASQKLSYASDARAMETVALDNDANLKEARQRMVEASRRVSDLRARFDSSVRDNPRILAARRNLEVARVEHLTAEADLRGAIIAGGAALDYAYNLHRYDFARPYPGAYDYGYNYYRTRY